MRELTNDTPQATLRRTGRVYDPIGFLVWWSFGEQVSYEKLYRAFTDLGLEKYLHHVRRPYPHVALQRACDEVQHRLHRSAGRTKGTRHVVRPIRSKIGRAKGEVYYAVFEETLNEDGTVDTVVVAELESDGKGSPTITGNEAHPVVQEIHEAYERINNACAGELLGRALREIIETRGRGICLKKEGGLFFLPWRGKEDANLGLIVLRKLFKALEGSELFAAYAYADPRTVRTVAPAAEASILRELDRVETVFRRYTTLTRSHLEDGKKRQLGPIRRKATYYEERLGIKFKRVKRRCDELAALVDELAKQRTQYRKSIEEADPIDAPDDGLTLRQRVLLTKAKKGIAEAVERNDPYLRNICDVALAAVAKDCGVDAANRIIDDLRLTEVCKVGKLTEAQP